MDRVIAIMGDIHGEAELLVALLAKVREKYPEAEFYALGDLIDRGPSSKEVIQICIDENISAIIGNHDQWLQTLAVEKMFDSFCLHHAMGGKATLESYGVDLYSDGKNHFFKGRPDRDVAVDFYKALPTSHREWLATLPAYRILEVGGQKYWLFHAGLSDSVAETHRYLDGRELSDFEMVRRVVESSHGLNSILWSVPQIGEDKVKDNLYHFKDGIQIFGHRPVKYPILKEHFYAMDTGCGTCAPYTLSAIILPNKEIIQVSK